MTTIHLLGDCTDAGCLKLAGEMKMKLDTPQYRTGAAIMPIPTLDGWREEHRTARKRADRSKRLGYEFAEIDRSQYANDIYMINVSMPYRQGRPMSQGYRTTNVPGKLPDYPCERHNVRTYGVLKAGRLRAYLTLYRVNQLALVSMILGHGDHLRDDVMWLMFEGVVGSQQFLGGWFYYNLWNSGQDGLRYYKAHVGFYAGDVAWSM